MKLYHGTSTARLEAIRFGGIQPPKISRVDTNWSHTIESNRNSVYLTDTYPFHFAAQASDKTKTPGLILEIDRLALSVPYLSPDEDFLEQWTRGRGPTESCPDLAHTFWDMVKRTRHYRQRAQSMGKKYFAAERTLTDLSLQFMGTAGYYATVPWSAVTRYSIIDWARVPGYIRLSAMDTQVSIINHKVMKDQHKALIRWFMGDPVEVEEVMMVPPQMEGYGEMRSQVQAALDDRSGIRVEILRDEGLAA